MKTHWYRNGKRGRFHLEAADWVRSGKAVCGATIKNPGFTRSIEPGFPLPDVCCSRCARQLLRRTPYRHENEAGD